MRHLVGNGTPLPNRTLWGCVLLALLLLQVGAGHAQSDAPSEYAKAVQQAIQEFDARNYQEALAEFTRAHALFPNARSLRGMAMAEFELRDYASSARHLREALASQVKPLTSSLRAETEALLERAQRYLGELRVVTDPAEAALLIDGSPAQPRADGTLVLNPGEHVVEVRAPGRLTDTRAVQVTAGDQRQLMISLRMVERDRIEADEAAATTPLQPASTQSRSERQPAYRKWWVWTLVAVVAAAGATTAAVLLTRDDDPGDRPIEGTNTVGVSLHALSRF